MVSFSGKISRLWIVGRGAEENESKLMRRGRLLVRYGEEEREVSWLGKGKPLLGCLKGGRASCSGRVICS